MLNSTHQQCGTSHSCHWLLAYLDSTSWKTKDMMSWYGNAFGFAGPLWGESTCHRWIPLTKSHCLMRSSDVFFALSLSKLLNKQLIWWSEMPWRSCNVSIMNCIVRNSYCFAAGELLHINPCSMKFIIGNKQGKSEGFDSCDRPSNLKLDSNRQFFCPCDREIWWMTLQNNRAPLLCYFKLCASFCTHWWIQT